jgi:hypothetical protein
MRRFLLAGMLGWPLAGHALGLGQIGGEAVIGEGLQLEVALTGSEERPVDSNCISVRRVPDGIDADYFPRDLAGRVDRQPGALRVLLASRNAVRQPIVEFRIFVGCGYNLYRDYLLMAAPRREAPAAAPVAAANAPGVAIAPAPAAAAAVPVVAAPVRLPDGIAGRNVILDRDLTLEQLARQHFPGPLRQQRFMRWVVEANPQHFSGSGARLRQQRLAAGTALTIPAAVPPRRTGDHQGTVTPLGERIAESGAPAIAPAKPKPGDGDTARAPASGKDRLVVGSGNSARNLKEAVALIDRLTGMMEQQVNAQTAYTEKIQQLETTVADLGKQLKVLEDEAAKREKAWQAERQAEKAARDAEAERAWWRLLGAALAGGVIGGGLLFALRSLAARKADPADDGLDLPTELVPPAAEPASVPAPAPAPIAAPTPQPPASRSTPLTQFGWDDESHPAPKTAPPPRPAPAVQHIDFEMPLDMAAAPETGDPAKAAIELANIMTSMGLAESAAQTLVEHIRENPRESLPQWLKLLEIHRLNGNRSEFERSATEMRQHFNVQPDDWNAPASPGRNSLEAYPHIRSQIVRLWRRPECEILLRALLLDNREGTRMGFPLAVAEEILLLLAILNNGR